MDTPNFNSWKWQLQNASNHHPQNSAATSVSDVVLEYPFLATPYSQKFFTVSHVLKQIYEPSVLELSSHYNVTSKDVMGDEVNMISPGVIHKYDSRVLLVTSSQCPMYCRYCTRKNGVVDLFDVSKLSELYDYTLKNGVNEVILSGGEVFMLSNAEIELYLSQIDSWEHIDTIRMHTKMLSTLPMRFYDDELLSIVEKYSSKLWVLTHFVSHEEINDYVIKAIRNIQKCGVYLLNQNPVLKGVNDTAVQLKELFTSLIKLKIKPYYLFQIDQVDGTSHFYVDLKDVLAMMKELQGNISGIALPKVIVDLPEGKGKVPVENNYLVGENDEAYQFVSTVGKTSSYYKY